MMNEINRPTFLTVLCVLTFVGSGWGIFNAISSYKNAEVAVGITNEVMDEVLDEIEDNAGSDREADIATKILGAVTDGLTVENVKNLGVANGIAAILTLVGAILMWGLNKKGYWIYLIGITVGIIAPLMVYEGILGAMTSGGSAFIGVIFAVLYGLNLKHLHD